MRQIKFRAWDKRNKKMLKVAGVELISGREIVSVGTLLPDEVVYGKANGSNLSLMQYTGLHDKNGREIYDGDVVRWGDMVGFGHEKPVRVAVVRFDPDICFDSNVGIFDYGNFAYEETDKYLTVIGNKYENPELLEVEVHDAG